MATLKATDSGGVKILHLAGSLTCEGVDQVADVFTAEAQGKSPLVVDLADVDLIATPGLAMLISADRTLKKAGGRMILTGSQQFVTELLHRCRLDRVWTVVQDPEEAVRQAQQSL